MPQREIGLYISSLRVSLSGFDIPLDTFFICPSEFILYPPCFTARMQLNGWHQWAPLLSGCWYSCYWSPLAGDSRVRDKWSLDTFSPHFFSIGLQFDTFPWQRSPLHPKFRKSFSQIVPLGQRVILAVITTISKSDTVGSLSVKLSSVDFPKVSPHHRKEFLLGNLSSPVWVCQLLPSVTPTDTDIKLTLTSKWELHIFVAFLL